MSPCIDIAISETATYGAYLEGRMQSNNGITEKEVLVNACAGVGVRTRIKHNSHSLAKGLGYGAINCCQVLQN